MVKFNRYTVTDVEVTRHESWETLVADIYVHNDPTLYRIGPAHSPKQLVQMVLERFGK